MGKVVLFTKNGCALCEWAKTRIPKGKFQEMDVETPEGLAMLAYYEAVGVAEKKLPILVADNGARLLLSDLKLIAKFFGVPYTAPAADCVGDSCSI